MKRLNYYKLLEQYDIINHIQYMIYYDLQTDFSHIAYMIQASCVYDKGFFVSRVVENKTNDYHIRYINQP